MTILENIPLSTYTTFKIGGNARYFCTVSNTKELTHALDFAHTRTVSFFILGGGSNVLVSDRGFSGLVIKMEMRGISFEEKDEYVYVTVGAGELWDELVAKTVESNIWGLENLSLIPGTTGASPVQNIGAYGVEVKEYIYSVHTLDYTGKERIFNNTECCFGYRSSIFKKAEYKKHIITFVTFRLSKKPRPITEYKDIRDFFSAKKNTNPSQLDIRKAVIAIRTGKFPDLSEIGTAGSFWKNPVIRKEQFEALAKTYPLIPSFPTQDGVKVPLAYILDVVCGLKGFKQNHVGLFNKQPLVLIAEKGASSDDVDALALQVATLVKEKTGIVIEREVESIG